MTVDKHCSSPSCRAAACRPASGCRATTRTEIRALVRIGIHANWGSGSDIDDTRDSVACRCKRSSCYPATSGRVEERRDRAEIDLATSPMPSCDRRFSCVFAGLIGEIRNPFSVGRPGRVAVPRLPECWSDCEYRRARRGRSEFPRGPQIRRARRSERCPRSGSARRHSGNVAARPENRRSTWMWTACCLPLEGSNR